ncbi:MAG: MepB family protein [Lactococcus chungangensis]
MKVEYQNAAYEGAYFELNGHQYRSRLAKMTPKKKGYFVVFWEKDNKNQNQPYEFAASPDRLIISVMDGHLQGQFIFPKSILFKKVYLVALIRR